MIGSDYLPGKRFLLIEIPRSSTNRGGRSTTKAGGSSNAITSGFVSGIIRCCNIETNLSTGSVPKNLKVNVQCNEREDIEEINPTKLKRKFFLIEHLIVEVPGYPRRWPALLFKRLIDAGQGESDLYVQHFGTKIVEKIPRKSISPFKFNWEKRSSLHEVVLQDLSAWLIIQKTQLLLLKGPYTITSCQVDIHANGKKTRATLTNHDIFEKKLKVLYSREMKATVIDPKLTQVEFACSDDGLNAMLAGNALPKRCSRHTHPSHQLSITNSMKNWTPPSWMAVETKYNHSIEEIAGRTKHRHRNSRSSTSSSVSTLGNSRDASDSLNHPECIQTNGHWDLSPTYRGYNLHQGVQSQLSCVKPPTTSTTVAVTSIPSPSSTNSSVPHVNGETPAVEMSEYWFPHHTKHMESNTNPCPLVATTISSFQRAPNSIPSTTFCVKPRPSTYPYETSLQNSPTKLKICSPISQSSTERAAETSVIKTHGTASHDISKRSNSPTTATTMKPLPQPNYAFNHCNQQIDNSIEFEKTTSKLNQLELLSVLYKSPNKSPLKDIQDGFAKEIASIGNEQEDEFSSINPSSRSNVTENAAASSIQLSILVSSSQPPVSSVISYSKLCISSMTNPAFSTNSNNLQQRHHQSCSSQETLSSIIPATAPLESPRNQENLYSSCIKKNHIYQGKGSESSSSHLTTAYNICTMQDFIQRQSQQPHFDVSKGVVSTGQHQNIQSTSPSASETKKQPKLSSFQRRKTIDGGSSSYENHVVSPSAVTPDLTRSLSQSNEKTKRKKQKERRLEIGDELKELLSYAPVKSSVKSSETTSLSETPSVLSVKKSTTSLTTSETSNKGSSSDQISTSYPSSFRKAPQVSYSCSDPATAQFNNSQLFKPSTYSQSTRSFANGIKQLDVYLPLVSQSYEFQQVLHHHKGDSAYESIAILQDFYYNHYRNYYDVCSLMTELDKTFFDKSLLLVTKVPKINGCSKSGFDVNSPGLDWSLIYSKLESFLQGCYQHAMSLQQQNHDVMSQYYQQMSNTASSVSYSEQFSYTDNAYQQYPSYYDAQNLWNIYSRHSSVLDQQHQQSQQYQEYQYQQQYSLQYEDSHQQQTKHQQHQLSPQYSQTSNPQEINLYPQQKQQQQQQPQQQQQQQQKQQHQQQGPHQYYQTELLQQHHLTQYYQQSDNQQYNTHSKTPKELPKETKEQLLLQKKQHEVDLVRLKQYLPNGCDIMLKKKEEAEQQQQQQQQPHLQQKCQEPQNYQQIEEFQQQQQQQKQKQQEGDSLVSKPHPRIEESTTQQEQLNTNIHSTPSDTMRSYSMEQQYWEHGVPDINPSDTSTQCAIMKPQGATENVTPMESTVIPTIDLNKIRKLTPEQLTKASARIHGSRGTPYQTTSPVSASDINNTPNTNKVSVLHPSKHLRNRSLNSSVIQSTKKYTVLPPTSITDTLGTFVMRNPNIVDSNTRPCTAHAFNEAASSESVPSTSVSNSPSTPSDSEPGPDKVQFSVGSLLQQTDDHKPKEDTKRESFAEKKQQFTDQSYDTNHRLKEQVSAPEKVECDKTVKERYEKLVHEFIADLYSSKFVTNNRITIPSRKSQNITNVNVFDVVKQNNESVDRKNKKLLTPDNNGDITNKVDSKRSTSSTKRPPARRKVKERISRTECGLLKFIECVPDNVILRKSGILNMIDVQDGDLIDSYCEKLAEVRKSCNENLTLTGKQDSNGVSSLENNDEPSKRRPSKRRPSKRTGIGRRKPRNTAKTLRKKRNVQTETAPETASEPDGEEIPYDSSRTVSASSEGSDESKFDRNATQASLLNEALLRFEEETKNCISNSNAESTSSLGTINTVLFSNTTEYGDDVFEASATIDRDENKSSGDGPNTPLHGSPTEPGIVESLNTSRYDCNTERFDGKQQYVKSSIQDVEMCEVETPLETITNPSTENSHQHEKNRKINTTTSLNEPTMRYTEDHPKVLSASVSSDLENKSGPISLNVITYSQEEAEKSQQEAEIDGRESLAAAAVEDKSNQQEESNTPSTDAVLPAPGAIQPSQEIVSSLRTGSQAKLNSTGFQGTHVIDSSDEKLNTKPVITASKGFFIKDIVSNEDSHNNATPRSPSSPLAVQLINATSVPKRPRDDVDVSMFVGVLATTNTPSTVPVVSLSSQPAVLTSVEASVTPKQETPSSKEELKTTQVESTVATTVHTITSFTSHVDTSTTVITSSVVQLVGTTNSKDSPSNTTTTTSTTTKKLIPTITSTSTVKAFPNIASNKFTSFKCNDETPILPEDTMNFIQSVVENMRKLTSGSQHQQQHTLETTKILHDTLKKNFDKHEKLNNSSAPKEGASPPEIGQANHCRSNSRTSHRSSAGDQSKVNRNSSSPLSSRSVRRSSRTAAVNTQARIQQCQQNYYMFSSEDEEDATDTTDTYSDADYDSEQQQQQQQMRPKRTTSKSNNFDNVPTALKPRIAAMSPQKTFGLNLSPTVNITPSPIPASTNDMVRIAMTSPVSVAGDTIVKPINIPFSTWKPISNISIKTLPKRVGPPTIPKFDTSKLLADSKKFHMTTSTVASTSSSSPFSITSIANMSPSIRLSHIGMSFSKFKPSSKMSLLLNNPRIVGFNTSSGSTANPPVQCSAANPPAQCSTVTVSTFNNLCTLSTIASQLQKTKPNGTALNLLLLSNPKQTNAKVILKDCVVAKKCATATTSNPSLKATSSMAKMTDAANIPTVESEKTKKQKKTKYWYPKGEADDEEWSPTDSSARNKRKSLVEEALDNVPKKKIKTGYYLQTSTCNSYPKLPKCLDCKADHDDAMSDETYCRFTMFRRLTKTDSGKIRVAGFCTTEAAEDEDLVHWKFQDNTTIDVETCKRILIDIGAQFEQLVLQEQDASTWLKNSEMPAWKRAVLRVREMCDICATTMFNTHWTCEACGFGVCLDCFSAQLYIGKNKKDSLVDEWSDCEVTDSLHKPKELRVTKIIPNNLLQELYNDLLSTCEKIGLKFKRLDLLEFSHHRGYPDIMKSNINWKEDPLSMESAIKMNLDVSMPDLPSTPAECAWYCNGRILHIQNSRFSPEAMVLFKSEWAKGKPIIVSNVHHKLNKDLWTPQSFQKDFGEELNDVVNCFDGTVMEKMPIWKFWKGFESIKDRPTCKEPVALLKLKDWPPGTDFKEKLPNRFNDLMQALPASIYTHRNGELNLSARLPDFFAVPDLGPKMYNAYGSSSYPSAGTTNLHLDISDATNTIAYVGIPNDKGFREKEIEDTLKTVDKACCEATRRRIRDPEVRPGALWHIFPAHSAEKIRRFLKRIAQERGMVLSECSDPIHDQTFYMDQPLLDRLKKEEDVEGYAICQCLGDAVFIPAGAPHQVLNLHSCIKVAEDFVAPEHISHCFQLTQEFRHLSDYHTNHEDKLQIKNIIYHSVKDCLGVVKKHLNV